MGQGVTELTISRGCSGVYDGSGNCIDNPTPEQRKEADDRARKEQERADAEARARQAKADDRKRKVDLEVSSMGEHRRKEAERLVDMREAANAVRPPLKRTCNTAQQVRYVDGGSVVSMAEARQRAASKWAASCKKPGWKCGEITCTEIKPINIRSGNQVLTSGSKSTYSCSAPASEEVKDCGPSAVSQQ